MTDAAGAQRVDADNLVAEWLDHWRGHVAMLKPEAFSDLIERIEARLRAVEGEREAARQDAMVAFNLMQDRAMRAEAEARRLREENAALRTRLNLMGVVLLDDC